jgi:hypothetical protein
MPPIRLLIPDDIPAEVVLKGPPERHLKGRNLYENGFYFGWREYWREYKAGLVSLRNEKSEPGVLLTLTVVEERGLYDGFRACRKALLAEGRPDRVQQ